MLQEMRDFYQKHHLKRGNDSRTPSEISSQKTIVQSLCHRNLSTFHITLTQKTSTKYPLLKVERVELQNGVYCYISDNKTKSQQTIIAIHGAPGGIQQWNGLQTMMGDRVRWINFAIPGFDGEDERRGTYKGSFEDIKALLISLFLKLGVKRVVICGSSFGTSIGNRMARECPEFIEGVINIAGATVFWSTGITIMHKLCVAEFGYYEEQWQKQGSINTDSERKQIYRKYEQLNTKGDYAEMMIPFLKPTELFAFIKLNQISPTAYDQQFENFPALDVPRVLIYSTNDHMIPIEKVQATIYAVSFGNQSFGNSPHTQKLLHLAKSPIEQRLKTVLGISIEGERLQEYLNFIFPQTGHAIHRRRPSQISKIIEAYLLILQVIHEQKLLVKPTL